MNLRLALRLSLVPLLAITLAACPSTPAPTDPTTNPPTTPGSAPAQPTNFVVSSADATSLTLTWKLVSDASSYVLERKTAGSAFAQIATPDAKTNTYKDTNLSVGTTYSYSLKAVNSGGSSDAALLDAVPSAGGADTDGDGISDADELAGYDVTITRGGTQISTRKVASNPGLADTDGDGLSDAQERTRFTDPTRADTDADGLTDNAEVSTWVSNPTDVDTDNDSNGNPALFDGNELKDYGTSPTLADTDGDQYSDYREIIELGGVFNPLVANTPRFELAYQNAPSITVDIGQTGSTSVTSSKSSNLTLNTTTSRSSTDTQTQRFNAEVSATVGAEVSGGTGGFNATVSASVTATVGYGTENTRSFTNDSSRSTEQSAAEALEQASVSGFELKGGKLTVGMLLKNTGDVTFTLTNLGVTALRRDRNDPDSFVVVGTMGFNPGTPSSFTLQTNEAAKSVGLTLDLAGNVAQELMQNPADLKFEFSSYDLQDANGRSFKFQNDTTNAQTALLVLDYGNGHTNRYRVATNVERTAGQIVGVKLGKVLSDTLKLPYTTTLNGGARVLRSLFDPTPGTNAPISSSAGDKTVWAVVGTNGLSITSSTNVDEIVLKAGSEVRVMLLRDVDGDRLLDSEEYFYGTSDSNVDSDGDTISDFDEVRTGWTVTTTAAVRGYPRTVLPNPTTVNSDSDTLNDAQERAKGTDPRNPDTDRDGTVDDADPQPLNPLVGANIAPTLTGVTSSVSGSVVTLGATANDTNLSNVVINWGDGTPNTTVSATSGVAFSRQHTYASSQAYTITVTATDAGGLTASATQNVNILDITTNLLAYYAMNGNANDSSGQGKNASRSSSCVFDDANRGGLAASALRFNANDGGAGCGASNIGSLQTPFLAYSANFTFSLWLKPNNNNDMWVFGQSTSNGQTQWARFVLGQTTDASNGSATVGVSGRASFFIPAAGGNSLLVTDTANVSQTAWTHYAVTVSNSAGNTVARLYRNGVQVASTTKNGVTYTNPSTTSPNLIGTGQNNNNSGLRPFYGLLDDFRIYGRALAANEIDALSKLPN
jgi:hypothetical protein